MNDLLKSIKCKLHHNKDSNYLSIDQRTFNVICLYCDQVNLSSKENLYRDETVESNYRPCSKHQNEEGLFYCDDCSGLICKICFATIHKQHNCSTIDLIVSDIKHHLHKLYSRFKVLQLELSKNSNQAELMNKITYIQKHNFQVKIDSIVQNITNALIENKDRLIESIQKSFENISLDNDTNKKQLGIANDFYHELKELIEYISEPFNTDLKVCLFKQSNGKEIYNRYQSIMLQLKGIKEIQSIEDILTNIYQTKKQMIFLYEQSLLHSIQSKLPNDTFKLKRFNHYYQSTSKYFKINSLCFITTHSIYLKGLGVCGLFPISENNKCFQYKINLSIYQVEDVNSFNLNNNPLSSNNITIPIMTNAIDPIYQYNLKTPIVILKNTLYYIILANNSDLSFVNTWIGSVSKEIDDNINQHSVICNNSAVKFNFLNSHGINSDFNEFSDGIISTMYFNQIE